MTYRLGAAPNTVVTSADSILAASNRVVCSSPLAVHEGEQHREMRRRPPVFSERGDALAALDPRLEEREDGAVEPALA